MKRIVEGDKVTVQQGGEDRSGIVKVIDRRVSPIQYAVSLEGHPSLDWFYRSDLTKAETK